MMKRTIKPIYSSKLALVIIALAFVIIIAITSISSIISANTFRNETLATNSMFLNKISLLFESQVLSIDQIVMPFMSNNIDTANISSNINAPYQRYLLYEKINSELLENCDFIESIYIYFENGKKVYYIDSESGMNNIIETKLFYDRDIFLDFQSNHSYPQMIRSRIAAPVYNAILENRQSTIKVISFIKGIPIFKPNSKNAIQVNIKEDYFTKIAYSDYMPQDSIIIVFDKDGNLLLSTDDNGNKTVKLTDNNILTITSTIKAVENRPVFSTVNINNEKYSYMLLKNESSERIYSLITPERVLLKPIYIVNITLFIVAGVILLIAVFISLMIDKRFFQPVLTLLQNLKIKVGNDVHLSISPSVEKGKNRNLTEFKQIKGYIDDIVSQNESQETLLNDYFRNYKRYILLSILNDSKATNKIADEVVIFSSDIKYYSIIVVQNYYSQDNQNGIVESLMSGLCEYGKIEIVKIDNNSTALLLGLKDHINLDIITTHADTVLNSLSESTGQFIYISTITDSILDIKKSFRNAENILAPLSSASANAVYGLSDVSLSSSKSVKYPEHIEKMMIKSISNKKYDHINLDLDSFFGFIHDNSIQFERAKIFTLILIHNLSKLLVNNDENLFESTTIDKSGQFITIGQLEEWTRNTFAKYIYGIDQEEELNNNYLIEKVENYIKTHYVEDIGLNTIAEYVYLSPSYLGRLFKEVTGVTFTHYLINVRMEAAADLLINKNFNVNDIAKKVGYYSVQSFCRLFKSYYNCTPSEYRRNNISNSLRT